jgi:YggT family protein
MLRFIGFVDYLLNLYILIIIATAIMSWLVAFNVINIRNDFVRSVYYGLNVITEPALRPIRRLMPDLGGIDISPVILILILMFIRSVIIANLADYFVASAPSSRRRKACFFSPRGVSERISVDVMWGCPFAFS